MQPLFAMSFLPPTALEIHHRLLAHFGPVDWRPSLGPIDELVSTILSQSTSDLNRYRGYNNLLEQFGNWEAVRVADVAEIEAAIRVSGLSKQKSPRIKAALEFIYNEQGVLTLDFLKTYSVEGARNWLTQMKGIGIKTASIILLFALDMPAFPVDTHVHRTSKRIGLIPPKMSAEKAHHHLEAALPTNTYFDAHLNMIRLGREICQARKPKCDQCPLTSICAYFQTQVTNEAFA
ncbi:MAG: endonuclease III [Chloroflexota bacterium]